MDRLAAVVSLVSYGGFFVIMLLIVLDVFLRYAFNSPILGSYEIIERIIFCAVFASFAYAQTQKAHIHITMVLSMLHRKLRFLCTTFTGLLSAALALFVAYAAIRQGRVAQASHYTTSVLLIALYPFYWVEAAAMGVFFLTLLFDALKNFVAVFDDDTAREIQSTWSN